MSGVAYLTEVYRNALAREVRGLGYEIEPCHDFNDSGCNSGPKRLSSNPSDILSPYATKPKAVIINRFCIRRPAFIYTLEAWVR